MSTLIQQPTQAPKWSWRKIVWGAMALLFLGLIGAGFGLFFSPIGERMRAEQLAAEPMTGVNRIELLADESLNHVFSPAVVQVPAGTTLTWEFADVDEDGQPVQHNVIFEDQGSDIMATGEYSVTFNEPGQYDYVCTLHAFMEGRVIVSES